MSYVIIMYFNFIQVEIYKYNKILFILLIIAEASTYPSV